MLTDAVPGDGSRALPLRWLWRWARFLPVILALMAGGCSPDAFLLSDEDRDREFQRARDAERLEDYAAAAEHYERALDRNPRHPAAHLGYATISQFQLRRYAEAVYHYERYLRLRPNDPKAQDIRHLITNCMERLATSVPLVIRSETIARDLEAVRGENQSLRLQVSNLMATTGYWSNECRRLASASFQLPPAAASPAGSSGSTNQSTRGSASTRSPAASAGSPSRSAASPPSAPAASAGRTPSRSSTAVLPPAAPRYHRVLSGETMASIARRYGVTESALRHANPRVEPRLLRAGMDLRIPAR